MARRSDQGAGWRATKGVGRGDSVIVMLGNQVELWESMLGLMKLGAVVMPTTTAVGSAEMADRIDRGAAREVICDPGVAKKVDDVPVNDLRIAVRRAHTRPVWPEHDDASPPPKEPMVSPYTGSYDQVP